MYHLFGIRPTLETVISLSKPYLRKNENIEQAYLRMLNDVQPTIYRSRQGEDEYIYDGNLVKKLIPEFYDQSELTDLKAFIEETPISSMEPALFKIKHGFEHLHSIDGVLSDVAKLIFTSIFYARSHLQGGGSTSNAIGVLWCANRPEWSSLDLAEFLVHELTHQFMFLDEMKYKHYQNIKSLEDKRTFTQSTILARKRPLDKVIHSLVVGVEILLFRLKNKLPEDGGKVHPSNEKILQNIEITISELKDLLTAKRDVVLPRFELILEKCDNTVKSMR